MTKHITLAQKIAINKKLEDVCAKNSDGTALYKDPWNDDLVAKSVGGSVSTAHVRYIRQQLFGKVRSRNGEGGDEGRQSGKIYRRMNDAEANLQMIMDYLTSKWPDWKSHVGPLI